MNIYCKNIKDAHKVLSFLDQDMEFATYIGGGTHTISRATFLNIIHHANGVSLIIEGDECIYTGMSCTDVTHGRIDASLLLEMAKHIAVTIWLDDIKLWLTDEQVVCLLENADEFDIELTDDDLTIKKVYCV